MNAGPVPFPESTTPIPDRREVFLGYLEYFRSALVLKLESLPGDELRRSRLPSGWTPLELIRHLTMVEVRWLEWGFEGRRVAQPWADEREGRWYVPPGVTLAELVIALDEQAARSRAVVSGHDLAEAGQPGERWNGAMPATLERVLFHLVQEYARHLGQLDVVCELAGGAVGE